MKKGTLFFTRLNDSLTFFRKDSLVFSCILCRKKIFSFIINIYNVINIIIIYDDNDNHVTFFCLLDSTRGPRSLEGGGVGLGTTVSHFPLGLTSS